MNLRLRAHSRNRWGWFLQVTIAPSTDAFVCSHHHVYSSVFQAVDIDNHRVAACKLIYITDKTTDKERKTVDKEMKIHAALKHRNVLEFISAVFVELKFKHHYVPGIYMLLEFATGGDLFDKIGGCDVKPAVVSPCSNLRQPQISVQAKMWPICISNSWWTGWHVPSFPCLIAPLAQRRTGIHSRARRVSQRPQTRKSTSRRRRNAQDIRLWPLCRLQTKGDREDASSDRALWQLTLHRARGVWPRFSR